MNPHARTLGTWSAVLLLPAILIAAPNSQSTKAIGTGPQNATGPLACADSLKDQAGPGCLQASSAATSGLLFPYPGAGNTFTPPAVVSGGENSAATGTRSAVGGGYANTASGEHSTIAGGSNNTASGLGSSVSGGYNHDASGVVSTIGGGFLNSTSGYFTTVAGGYGNAVSGFNSTIGGGSGNMASGTNATVGGGSYNEAVGSNATVGGGVFNEAVGSASFAAGAHAKADHDGAFVWGDSSAFNKTSSASDEFNVYAEGGVRMFAVGQTTPSMVVAPDGNVGVGTTAPESCLQVDGFRANFSPTEGVHMGNAGTSMGIEIAGADSIANIDFSVGDQGDFGARLRYQSSTDLLDVQGADFAVAGDICATGTIGACSDERFKESVESLEGALDKVRAIRGVTYDWRTEDYPDHQFTESSQVGFVAQELLEVLPEVVAQGRDGYYFVDYGKLTPVLVEAVKEMAADAEKKDAEIARLRADLDELRAALTSR